jgi:hypothetical protein
MDLSHFAKYTIKANSVPYNFNISSSVDEMLTTQLEGYNFEKELQVSFSCSHLSNLQDHHSR